MRSLGGSWLMRAIIALVLALNTWYDYRRAQGWLIIDAILALVIAIGLIKSRK